MTNIKLFKDCMEEAAELLAAIRIYDTSGNYENMREELGEALDGIHDILRTTTRISLKSVGPKELLSLKFSIRFCLKTKSPLSGA